MKIYIVIWEDRHTDVQVYPFTDSVKAINAAKEIAVNNARYKDDYEEHNYGKDSGWLFYANYSCEGDSVRVVTTELDKETFNAKNNGK